jgi:hypothetical protein
MTARTRIVRIGNWRGIRVPKHLLDIANLSDEVEVRAAPIPYDARSGVLGVGSDADVS